METIRRKQVFLSRGYMGDLKIQVSYNSDGHLVIREYDPYHKDNEPYDKVNVCQNCLKQIYYDGSVWKHVDSNSQCTNPDPTDVKYFEPEEEMFVFSKEESDALIDFILKNIRRDEKNE